MNPGTPVCLPCLDAHVRCHHPDPDCADLEQSLERLKWPHSREEIDLLLETTIESAAEQLATSRSTTSGEQVLNRYSQLAIHDVAAPKASTSSSRTKALSTIPVTTSTSRTQTKGTPSSSSRQLATASTSSAQASTSTSASASTSSIHAHTNGYVPPPPPPYLTKDTPLMTSLPPSPSSATVKLTAPVPPLTSVSPRNNQLSRSATFPTSLSNPLPQVGQSSGLPGRSQNMTLPTKPALYTSSWSRNSIRKSVSFAFSEGDVTESDEDEEEEIERGLLPEEDHEPHSPSPYTLSSISSASRYSIPHNRPSSPPWQLKPSVTDVVGAIETLSSSLQQTKAKFDLASKTILTQDRKIKALEEEVLRLRTAADTRGDEKSLNSSVWKSTFDIPTVGANPQPRILNRNMVNGHSGGGDSGEVQERDGRVYEDVGIQAYDELDV
ncbi:hypothetical protein C8Q75DRAFT_602947 [Abortiporus biennis]|nr:hypothetical protein C8Q75DRAFT_602947 [Abortiporus biennis]